MDLNYVTQHSAAPRSFPFVLMVFNLLKAPLVGQVYRAFACWQPCQLGGLVQNLMCSLVLCFTSATSGVWLLGQVLDGILARHDWRALPTRCTK